LILLAETFVKDGKWDVEAYKQYLNTYAGDGSPLNEREFHGAIQDRLKEIDMSGNGEENCTPETCSADMDENVKEEPTKELDNLIHYTTYGDTWKELVKAYYPGLVEKCGGLWGKNGAIKALQRALCTDESGKFDQAEFKKLIGEHNLRKEIKLPLKVNGIQRVKGNVKKVDFTPDQLAATNSQGKTIGYDQYKVGMKRVPTGWLATDNCDGSTASGSTKQEALDNLERLTNKKYSNRDELLKN